MSHIALEYGSASVATDLVAPILFAATLPGLPDPEEEIRRALAELGKQPVFAVPMERRSVIDHVVQAVRVLRTGRVTERLQVVLDLGQLRPTHLRGRKPET